MFWETKDPRSHNIEILLESPDTKVEVFLEEDNIIQECKTQKKSIVNYFIRPDVIRRMIELVTTEPPEEVPISERFRHANVACEILTMGLPSLDEKLLADVDTLNMLYSYLENEPPLNPLLASFFSKTFSMLFTKKPDQDWFSYQQKCLKLLEYVKSKSNFLDLICKHFTTPIVPDLIMEMMQVVEGVQLKRSLFEWLNEERLIEKLIEIIGDPEQCEKHASVADFLCDLIHQGRTMRLEIDTFEPVFEGSDPILHKIESATTLLALFNVILQPNAIESAIVSGITVVLKIIKLVEVTGERDTERLLCLLANESKIHDEFLTTVIRVIEPQLKHFNELLKNPPKKSDILTSAAKLSPPFGMARLQVCRLFAELLKTKNEEILKGICETDFLNVLLSLFKEYCWNNFLHNEVEKCLSAIFPYVATAENAKTNNNATQENVDNELDKMLNMIIIKQDFLEMCLLGDPVNKTTDNIPSAIQTHAIVNCQIISKLIDCWKTNKEMESAEKGRRLGYMGHLINILKHITMCISQSEVIGALIESNLKDEDERSLWQSIVNTTDGDLTEALNTQSKLLANHEPCENNVSLDFFTDNNISDAFNGLCSLMDSSDSFGRNNDDDDEGVEDESAAASFDADNGLSFYIEPHENPFAEDSWENNTVLDDIMRGFFNNKTEQNTFADFGAFSFGSLQSANTNEITAAKESIAAVATTSSEEYDNNANVEKSASWSGDFTPFQIPKKDSQFTSNFVDDYEDDEGMWTKPLGATNSTACDEHFDETPSSKSTINQTDECTTQNNFLTNGPAALKESEDVTEAASLNQLNSSIEDNTLVDQTTEEINEINTELNTTQQDKEEEDKEITSKHKSHILDNDDDDDTKTGNITQTTHTPTNQLINTTPAVEEMSDGSNAAATTTTT